MKKLCTVILSVATLSLVAEAQSLQAYTYEAEGNTYYKVVNAIPGSNAAFYTQRGGGRLLYSQAVDDQGKTLVSTANQFPAFVINNTNIETGVKGSRKVVHFDREKEFTIRQIELSNKNGHTILSWQASVADKEKYGFEITGSTDKIHFTTLAAIDAQNEKLLNYEYEIADKRISYYQLKVKGKNNDLSYTSRIMQPGEDIALIYPTLCKNEIYVTLPVPANNAGYTIDNMQGQTVKQDKLSQTDNNINLSDVASGMYFIKVSSNGRTMVQKIIKE